MKTYLNILFGALILLGIGILWVFIFAAPFWLVWNCIISVKFGIPTFTFAESFFVILIIKWLFGVADLKKIKEQNYLLSKKDFQFLESLHYKYKV